MIPAAPLLLPQMRSGYPFIRWFSLWLLVMAWPIRGQESPPAAQSPAPETAPASDPGSSSTVPPPEASPAPGESAPAEPTPTPPPPIPRETFSYAVPVASDSPWPLFRRDEVNSGRSPLRAGWRGDRPWSFRTGKGIFSTPVIAGDGTILVGSGDHIFYALRPDGTERWRFKTGEIIDSAGALPAPGPAQNSQTVIFPSGDGHLYQLRLDDGLTDASRLLWSFDVSKHPGTGFNNWCEGNVAIGPDGGIYAGSTNFNYYALKADGSLRWTYPTGSNNWSQTAFGQDGTLFWASNDTFIHAVTPDGTLKWKRRTLGSIAASVALGSDGTAYIGSFDSYFYALDPLTGAVRWKFKTSDHIYASAAVGVGPDDKTNALYVGSADGTLYALAPDGSLLWKYDTGAPIRSSPVLGRKPQGEEGWLLYVGSGNGRLYCLDAATGARRWSFDTTPDDVELRDRNDLNGSPALGQLGIYIGGEHGDLYYVPYDYCLNVADARCQRGIGNELPADTLELAYVTPGGETLLKPRATPQGTAPVPVLSLPAATMLTMRLVAREKGQTLDVHLCSAPVVCDLFAPTKVRLEPDVPLDWETSADGQYLHILPRTFLEAGQTYTLSVEGNYYGGGLAIGNLSIGGHKLGKVKDTLTFQVAPAASRFPLAMENNSVGALQWTRLAVPIPTMMPSFNQLGFDYMEWILGLVSLTQPDAAGRGRVILWAVGARRDDAGRLVVDPASDFTLPLSGRYQADAFQVANQAFTMPITGIPIPFNRFELRGNLGTDGRTTGPAAYAETGVLSIPTFGKYLALAGLANNWVEKLVVSGTFLTRPYDPRGDANLRPNGVSLDTIRYRAPAGFKKGQVTVSLKLAPGSSLPAAQHRVAVVLVDAARGEAVSMDYHHHLKPVTDAQGNITGVTLEIPSSTRMPDRLEAIVIVDVFPIHRGHLKEKY